MQPKPSESCGFTSLGDYLARSIGSDFQVPMQVFEEAFYTVPAPMDAKPWKRGMACSGNRWPNSGLIGNLTSVDHVLHIGREQALHDRAILQHDAHEQR